MNRRISNLRVLLVASVTAVIGCQDSSVPTAPRYNPQTPSRAQVPDQAADQASLARSIPGFGGLFIDSDGVPAVYLTDPQNRGAMERALTAFARAHGVTPAQIRVLKGNYDYTQLDDWYSAATETAFADDGAIFTDLDEANNRVLIAVADAGATGRVRAALARSSIPSSAVAIEVREPVRFVTTLQQKLRPVVAGLQIHFGGFLCSLGFNATSADGQASFITASHCTNQQGGVEGTQYFQPLSSVDPTVIATEVADPPYFKNRGCPKGRSCRYSDASRARYSTGFTDFTLGAIAQTSGPNNGSLTIMGSFNVTGETPSGGVVGTTVNKVGRTTGWTQGRITNTCVNTGVQGTRIVQLCQTFVNAGVGGGDSGSGVFILDGSSVSIAGILWGGSGSSTYVFSPFGQIQQELGTLIVH